MPAVCLFQLFAFLVYADNGAPVEKPKDDAEAPLLISYDGVEFPSSDRPIKLINGRASFKLKISQVSILWKLIPWKFIDFKRTFWWCDPNHQYSVMGTFPLFVEREDYRVLTPNTSGFSWCIRTPENNIMTLQVLQRGPCFGDPDHWSNRAHCSWGKSPRISRLTICLL